MAKKLDTENTPSKTISDDSTNRREFLRKSLYAAYATPLITALLVENASAAQSKDDIFCMKHPDHPKCNP